MLSEFVVDYLNVSNLNDQDYLVLRNVCFGLNCSSIIDISLGNKESSYFFLNQASKKNYPYEIIING